MGHCGTVVGPKAKAVDLLDSLLDQYLQHLGDRGGI